MKPGWKKVTRAELDAYVAAYPRELVLDVNRIVEPHEISYNDFTLGVWPESRVARYSVGDPPNTLAYWGPESGWTVRDPIPDCGKEG